MLLNRPGQNTCSDVQEVRARIPGFLASLQSNVEIGLLGELVGVAGKKPPVPPTAEAFGIVSMTFKSLGWSILRSHVLPFETWRESQKGGDAEGAARQLMANDVFQEAIQLASPSLSQEWEAFFQTPSDFDQKRRAKLFASIRKYGNRAATRCTPFGSFAGLCLVPLGDAPTVRLGLPDEHHRRLRISYSYSLDQARAAERSRDSRLRLIANPVMITHGDRIIVPFGDNIYAAGEVTLENSPLLRAILKRTETPTPASEVVGAMAKGNQGIAENLNRYIDRLVDLEVLVPFVRPPLDSSDPSRHVLDEIGQSFGKERDNLLTLGSRCAEIERAPLGTATEAIRALGNDLQDVETGSAVDTVTFLGAQGGLPRAVADAAAEAARALLALQRPAPLDAFLELFRERYGQREVPVTEVVHPNGLGVPALYGDSVDLKFLERPDHRSRSITLLLGQLVARGLVSPTLEAVLSAADLESVPPARRKIYGSTVDLWGQLLAESEASLKSGTFRLKVIRVVHPTGRLLGRFAAFDSTAQERLSELARVEVESTPDVDFVQISGFPARLPGKRKPTARAPQVYPYQLASESAYTVGPERRCPLSDVLVGTLDDQFYFRSRKTGRRLLFRVPHVAYRGLLPPVLHFLLDVSLVRGYYWDWQEFSDFPVLPRVTLQDSRVMLCGARWQLPSAKSGVLTPSEVTAWRERWDIPGHVRVALDFDNVLLLNLDNPTDVEIFIHEARTSNRTGKRQWPSLPPGGFVEEAVPGPNDAWLKDKNGNHHFAEVLIPLLEERREALPELPPQLLIPVSDEQRLSLPGQGWLYFKLYTTRSNADAVLRGIRTAMAALAQPLEWFFLRYRDMPPSADLLPNAGAHLRFRVRLPDLQLLPREIFFATEFAEMFREGLVSRVEIDTYEREIERYGGVEAFQICERIFSVDSGSVVDLLNSAPNVCYDPVHAYFAVDAFARSLFPTADERACLYTLRKETSITPLNEARRRQLSDLLRSERPALWTALTPARAEDRDASARDAWAQSLRQSMDPLTESLRTLDASGQLVRPLLRIGAVLLHMHCNRMGLDLPREEAMMHVLATTFGGFHHYVPPGVCP